MLSPSRVLLTRLSRNTVRLRTRTAGPIHLRLPCVAARPVYHRQRVQTRQVATRVKGNKEAENATAVRGAGDYDVAIVGAGPAAFYAAKSILRGVDSVRIDMFERLPTPHGLVRTGVAPDHPDVKAVVNDFAAVLEDKRCSFWGNVTVGEHISLQQLQHHYSAVLLAYGADGDRSLGIPGEDLPGVHSAREFVNWYNGHPDFCDRSFDLSDETAVVIGQGNVAADVARVLLSPVDVLAKTDIAEHALEALSRSRVRRVECVARRGPVQTAIAIKELRELSKMEGCRLHIHEQEYALGLNDASGQEAQDRPLKRKCELMAKLVEEQKHTAVNEGSDRVVGLRFLLGPTQLVAGSKGRVNRVVFNRMQLSGDAGAQRATPDSKADPVSIDAGLVLKSVGYKSVPLDGAPFDAKTATVPNEKGRVIRAPGDAPVEALYVSGWLKRGPTGIIVTNMMDARETVACLIEDVAAGVVRPRPLIAGTPGRDVLLRKLQASHEQLIDTTGWLHIDNREKRLGQEKQKLRHKLVTWQDLLEVAKSSA